MFKDEFKDMLIAISSNVMCSGMGCDCCHDYFKSVDCPSTNNRFGHEERINFWKKIHEELMRQIDAEDDDIPFHRDDWGAEDIINIIKDKWEATYV
ncbi:MAG: hypothetical protein J6Y78_15685 [Paludibacteraceae bacterium]|nr:hypothetical protein [Paludibacteraceae bacterium]